MAKKALACNSSLKLTISRLKASLRPISLNATINTKPKLTLKISHAGKS